jgi:thiamine-phosphate pyrophosphorylase
MPNDAATRQAPKLPGVLLITDPKYADAHVARVVSLAGAALGAGRFAVLLRDKQRARERVRELALSLREATSTFGAALVIHSDAELALEVSADALHVADVSQLSAARAAFPGAVTTPAHDDADVSRAVLAGADAILVSPIFAAPGKGTPRGTAALRRARDLANGQLFVYALGGVSSSTAAACRSAGADGLAVLRALFDADDPAAEARALDAALRTYRRT